MKINSSSQVKFRKENQTMDSQTGVGAGAASEAGAGPELNIDPIQQHQQQQYKHWQWLQEQQTIVNHCTNIVMQSTNVASSIQLSTLQFIVNQRQLMFQYQSTGIYPIGMITGYGLYVATLQRISPTVSAMYHHTMANIYTPSSSEQGHTFQQQQQQPTTYQLQGNFSAIMNYIMGGNQGIVEELWPTNQVAQTERITGMEGDVIYQGNRYIAMEPMMIGYPIRYRLIAFHPQVQAFFQRITPFETQFPLRTSTSTSTTTSTTTSPSLQYPSPSLDEMTRQLWYLRCLYDISGQEISRDIYSHTFLMNTSSSSQSHQGSPSLPSTTNNNPTTRQDQDQENDLTRNETYLTATPTIRLDFENSELNTKSKDKFRPIPTFYG
jgi:hypothetical protein